jgi:hypothetical protein
MTDIEISADSDDHGIPLEVYLQLCDAIPFQFDIVVNQQQESTGRASDGGLPLAHGVGRFDRHISYEQSGGLPARILRDQAGRIIIATIGDDNFINFAGLHA